MSLLYNIRMSSKSRKINGIFVTSVLFFTYFYFYVPKKRDVQEKSVQRVNQIDFPLLQQEQELQQKQTQHLENEQEQHHEADASADLWESQMSARFAGRRRILSEACSKYKDFNDKIPGRPISMKMASNILLCHIPKVGSSTWVTHLSKINKRKTLEPHNYFDTSVISSYLESPTLDPSSPLHPAVRVISVRPPLERLVSCYRDKYAGGDNITLGIINPWETAMLYGRFHKPLMKSNNMLILEKGDILSVTFEQFVRHITKAQDCHWRPYYTQCSPCLYNYEYIMHLNRFEEELKYVYQKAQVEEDGLGFGAKVRESSAGGPKPSSPETMFENLPTDLLKKIHQIYRMDFFLFGFELPPFLKQFEI